MGVGFIFPGQGSHSIGMGVSLRDNFSCARLVFEEVEDALSFPLFRLMRDGPEDELRLTENAQPALLSVSACVLRILSEEGGISVTRADFLAGHSLGEYSALYASGVFGLADAVCLVRRRGSAMQSAVAPGRGLMAAILGLEMDEVDGVCERAAAAFDGVCVVANDNAPGQIVVSGDAPCVDRAVSLALERGAKRAILLPVSAPFHCALMAPAGDIMAEALACVRVDTPTVPVIANMSAAIMDSAPDLIRENLVQQVTGMVRWRASVEMMVGAGVDRFYELGSGRVLCGLTKRIAREVSCVSVGDTDSVVAMMKAFD